MNYALKVALGLVVGLPAGYLLMAETAISAEAKLSAFFAILFAGAIGIPLGLFVGHLLSKDSDVETRGFQAIALSNLVAWLIPVAGLMFCAMTFRFSKNSQGLTGIYLALSIVGGLLAVGNAAWGGAAAASG